MAVTWPLVGRRGELELLHRATEKRESGGVVVAGAPGVGKTRLAREAIAAAGDEGFSTAWAVGTHSAQSIPFGALAHLLPAEIPVRRARSNLLRAIAQAMLATAPPGRLVLGVDDAHLLDDSSAALLHHLALTRQAFAISTVRSTAPMPDAVASLTKDRLTVRLALSDLSRPEVEELVKHVLGSQVDGPTRHRLWELTRGNPLFLRELVQAGLDAGQLAQAGGVWRWTGPISGPRLVEVVEARVGRLSLEERSVLEVVALGEPLETVLLEALAPAGVQEAMERRGLLQESVDGSRSVVRLAHPLYAEVLRTTTPPARAREVNRALAVAVEAAGSRRREDILRLAVWQLQAGIAERPSTLVAAADRAMSLLDHSLAERLAAAAREAGAGFHAGLTLAGAMMRQGRFETAQNVLAQLEVEATTAVERVDATVMRADILGLHLARREEALRVLDAALDGLDRDPARDVVAADKAYLLAAWGRAEEALGIALAVLGRKGVPDRATPYAYGAAGQVLLYGGRPREALGLMERHLPALLRVIDQTPFGPASMGPTFHRYLAAVFSGYSSDATLISETAYEEAVERGIDWWTGTWAAAAGSSWLMQGRPRTALRWLREAVSLLREMNVFGHLSVALAELAHGLALLGDAEGSQQVLREADEASLASLPGLRGYAAPARIWTCAAAGELSRAREVAIEEAKALESLSLRVFEAISLHSVARLGEPARVVLRLRQLADACEGPLIELLADQAAALTDGDAVALDRISHQFEELGTTLHAAEAAAAAGGAYRREGMLARATAATARARVLAAVCEGARTPALADLDTRDLLTRREKEVTGLAARQLSNREIARRLGLSVRTVDNHLHRAYGKLEISGREELAEIFPSSFAATN